VARTPGKRASAALQRRRRTLALAAAWAASELLIVAGAFVGYSLHGDKMLLVLLWVLPGIGVGVWVMELFERWRGRSFGLFTGKIVFLLIFFPGIPLGYWLAEAVR
jgi:hypothetical protein